MTCPIPAFRHIAQQHRAASRQYIQRGTGASFAADPLAAPSIETSVFKLHSYPAAAGILDDAAADAYKADLDSFWELFTSESSIVQVCRRTPPLNCRQFVNRSRRTGVAI